MHIPDHAWKVIDKITTACPLCAFVRGLAIGLAAGVVLMLAY